MSKRILPANITSYDVLKTFAILTMIADHVGVYFYPEEMWWRVAGRLSAPVWLFLIGYARSRETPPLMLFGALALVAGSVVSGGHIFPLNILFLIYIIRLALDRVAGYVLSEKARLAAGGLVLLVAAFLTGSFVDYGTLGFIIALYGLMARRRHEGHPVPSEKIFAGFAAVSYIICMLASFDLEPAQMRVLLVSNLLLFGVLYYFRPVVYTGENIPGWLRSILFITGRRTMAIYVAHLLLFGFLAALWKMGGHAFLAPTLF